MRNDPVLFDFAAVLVFIVIGVAFCYMNLGIGWLIRPRKYEKDKMRIYECGEPTIGSSWVRFNVRFYTIALVFLVFDVETVFLFPVASVLRWYRDQGLGLAAFVEILGFVLVLGVGLVYAWRFGSLDWIRGSDDSAPGPEAGERR